MVMLKVLLKSNTWTQALRVIEVCIGEYVDDFILLCNLIMRFFSVTNNAMKPFTPATSSQLMIQIEVSMERYVGILNFAMFQLVKRKHLPDVIFKALLALNTLAKVTSPSMNYKYLHIPHAKVLLRYFINHYHISESIYHQSMVLIVNILSFNPIFLAPELFNIAHTNICSRIKSAIECRSLQADAYTYTTMIDALKLFTESPKVRVKLVAELSILDVNKFINLIRTAIGDNKLKGVKNYAYISMLKSSMDLFLVLYLPSISTREDVLMFVGNTLNLISEQVSSYDDVFINSIDVTRLHNHKTKASNINYNSTSSSLGEELELIKLLKPLSRINNFIALLENLVTENGNLRHTLIRRLEMTSNNNFRDKSGIIDALIVLYGAREVCWSPPEILTAVCSRRENVEKVCRNSRDLPVDSIRSDYSSLLNGYVEHDELENDGRRIILDRLIPPDLFQRFLKVTECAASSIPISAVDIFSDVSNFCLISRIMGTSALGTLVNLDKLAEYAVRGLNILGENLDTNETLGSSSVMNMNIILEGKRKCFELLTDIVVLRRLGTKPYVNQAYDHSMQMINTWTPTLGKGIIYSCLSLNISCALINESIRRHISLHLIKLHKLIEMIGVNDIIMPILLICHITLPAFHLDPHNSQNQEILFMIVFFGLQNDDVIVRNIACGLLVDIESTYSGMMRRLYSRKEIENILLYRLKNCTDGKQTIELLHACSACCRSFNIMPNWRHTSWSFSWQWSVRDKKIPDVASILSTHMQKIDNNSSPTNIYIFALSLGLSTNLMNIFIRNMGDCSKMIDASTSLAKLAVQCIPNGLAIVISDQRMIRYKSGSRLMGIEARNPHLLVAEAEYSVDLLYETMAFQTLEAIITFLCIEDMKPYCEYRNLFCDIPLSLSVIHLMTQYNNNQNIQRQGVYVLCYFAQSKIEIQILIEHSAQALEIAMNSLKTDSSVVSQFIFIMNIIAKTRSNSINCYENTKWQVNDLTFLRKYNLDTLLVELLWKNQIKPEDIISALYLFVQISACISCGAAIASTYWKALPRILLRILESPNTSPPTAVLLCMTAFTNICHLEEFGGGKNHKLGSSDAKKLLKLGRKRLSLMLKHMLSNKHDQLPDGCTKDQIELLICKCNDVERCSIM